MFKILDQRLKKLHDINLPNLLADKRIGIEKECLRVSLQGRIASTPHPASLGAALTHPHITTDYSEALLELITPPLSSNAEAAEFLVNTQKFVYTKLQDEILWCNSMPCVLSGEMSIPIAEYGNSNAGKMKTVYRRGLGHRYGRMMQVIAGIHYNYSFPKTFWQVYQELEENSQSDIEFTNDRYFGLIRNLQRFGWLIPYFFGCSPAVCRSFMDGIERILQPFDDYTYYQPFATSLRVGDIGYQNYKEGKSGIKANYDNLDSYVSGLRKAINTVCPDYQKIGIKQGEDYLQLNANLLQIENEYYSTVRPKQITARYEKPTTALKRDGVRYIELRSLDLNMFEHAGLNVDQLNFVEALICTCLLTDSPAINHDEQRYIDSNQNITAHRGREPGLLLQRQGGQIELRQWAIEITTAMHGVCEFLDKQAGQNIYSSALKTICERIDNPEKTPSARMLKEMAENNEAFYPISMRYAKHHAEYFQTVELSGDAKRYFEAQTEISLQQQHAIEEKDTLGFDQFLQAYFAETLPPE